MFSLFINNLGQELNSSGLGIDLDSTNISVICFADDIVLLGKSEKALDKLMDITRTFFSTHKLELSVKKSKVMTHNANTGHSIFTGTQTSPITLEQVLSFKYLGVPVCCSPRSLFSNYNEQVNTKLSGWSRFKQTSPYWVLI